MKAPYRVEARGIEQIGECESGHRVGDLVTFDGEGNEGRICWHSLCSMMYKVHGMLYGADYPWLNDKNVASHPCQDLKNPVVYEIRRFRERWSYNVIIDELLAFSLKRDTIGTVTGVYPPSRFGDLECEENSVIRFKEKLQDSKSKNPINGGFFVFKKSIFDYIPDDINCDLEKQRMNRLTDAGQLSVFRHEGYWQCMDTYRDFIQLNEQWKNKPLWKIWK